MGEKGLFDEELRLSNMGDPLEKLSERIDFEIFRGKIEIALEKEAKGAGGRTRFDVILMFKILLLQQWYNISDDNTEYLINDRLSFQRFLGLTLTDKVTDSKTIWHFREELKEAKIERKLFKRFASLLESQDLVKREGSIVDASFVDVPRQRNSREENKQIKEGEGEILWQENIHKKSQKDVDARWTTKNKERHYGYKNHVKHVFGYMTNSMGGMTNRVIGKKRNECMIALKNLAYNISRYAYLTKIPPQEVTVMG